MPFFNQIKYSEDISVYVWSLTETFNDLKYLCQRRGIDTTDVNDIRAKNRACERLAEKLLIKIICGEPFTLAHHDNGAPYILESELNISISHTAGTVCIATSTKSEIGIDVERKGTRVIKVRNKFLNELEKRWISEEDVDANLIAWTAKEALFKIVGEQEIDFREHLQLEPFKSEEEGFIDFRGSFTKHMPITQYEFLSTLGIDVIMTLVVKDGTKITKPDNNFISI